jgi:integrase
MTADDIDRLDARAVIERWQLKRLGNQESTQKAYASVLRRFEAWCLRHGAVACPATSSTVDAFLSHIGCENVGSRYNVRKSIAAAHVALDVPNQIIEGFKPRGAGRGRPNAATVANSAALHAQLDATARNLLDPAYLAPPVPAPGVAAQLERESARVLLAAEASSDADAGESDGDTNASESNADAEPVTLAAGESFDLDIIERRARALEVLDETVLETERRAHSKNTWRAYHQRLTIYLGWCYAMGLDPFPASTESVCRFLTWYGLHGGDGRGRAPSTLDVAKAALSYAHRIRELADPTAAYRVKRVLQGHKNNWLAPPRKARPLTTSEIRHLCEYLDRIGGMTAVRDKALFLILYAGCMRRSEATSRRLHEYEDDSVFELRIEQIEYTEKGATIHLLKTKTTSATETAPRHVAWGMEPVTCPVLALMAWIDLCARHGRTEGALFPTLRSIGDPLMGQVSFGDRSISVHYVGVLLKEHARAAGLRTDRLSTHSFRRGHAHEAHRNGAPMAEIQRQGQWASLHTVGEYLDEVASADNNSSQHLGL